MSIAHAGLSASMLLVSLAGCAAEHAIRVSVELAAEVDVVCLVARSEDASATDVAFAMPYDAAAWPMPASLTFVAAPGHTGDVTITARGVRAGSFVGGSTYFTTFASAGTGEATLRVSRCRERSTAGFGTRPGGTFAALREPAHMLAADYDGDGRDELLAIAADGSLAVVDAENVAEGSHRESELRIVTAGSMAAVGDLDLDCRADVIAAAPSGALVVDSANGQSFPPVGGTGGGANDVAIGRSDPDGPTLLLLAGAGGLASVGVDGAGRTVLATGVFEHVVTFDQEGDGATELAATGPDGLAVLEATDGDFVDVTALLPAALATLDGPLAVGDLDGDGDFDLVLSDATGLHLVERGTSAFMGPVPFPLVGVTRVVALDVTGDCEDDVIVLAGSMVMVLSMTDRALTETDVQADALDFVVGDFDAEGSREVAILGAGGRITLWQP